MYSGGGRDQSRRTHETSTGGRGGCGGVRRRLLEPASGSQSGASSPPLRCLVFEWRAPVANRVRKYRRGRPGKDARERERESERERTFVERSFRGRCLAKLSA